MKKVSKFRAVGLSLICPGLGHFYLRSWVKGVFFLGVTLISIWQISKPIRDVIALVHTTYSTLTTSILNGYVPNIKMNVDWLGVVKQTGLWTLIFTITFFWAIIDVFILARRLQEKSELMDDNA